MAGETGQYFVRRRGRIMGPFDLTQLERMLRRGNVNRRDACSTDRRNWTPLEDHEELFPKEIATGRDSDDDGDMKLDEEDSTPGSAGTELVTGDWFYHYQGNEQGPVTEDQIRKLIADGVLTTYDSVWKQGMEDWKPLGDVFDFPQAPTSGGMVPGQPGMMQPGMMQPGMMQPGMMQPGMVQPGMMQPGMMQPGMVQPGMMQPGMMQPGMMQPGMMQPGGINITVGTGASEPTVEQAGSGLIVCGYVFAILFFPVGLILGIVACAKGSATHGVAHILISLLTWGVSYALVMQNPQAFRVGFVVDSVLRLVG